MPRPRKLRPATNRMVKPKRMPNSASRAGTALGKISRRIIQPNPSPRSRAASTYSCTMMPCATSRASRNTRVASSTAMGQINTGTAATRTERIISAKISTGIAINVSARRESSRSTYRPSTTAAKPLTMPREKESKLIASAMPSVVRPPYNSRESMSRPMLSVPSRCSAPGSKQAVLPNRRRNAQQYRQRYHHQRRIAGQKQRVVKARHQVCGNRAAIGERSAQIALQEMQQPHQVTLQRWLIEAERSAQRRHRFRRGGLAENGRGNIAGQHLGADENQNRTQPPAQPAQQHS